MPSLDRLSRRTFAAAAPVAVAASLARPVAALAQPDASPTPGGDTLAAQAGATLADAVLAIEPARLLARLQTAPVETTLFPPDSGSLYPFPWQDDDDLRGSIGAVQFGVLIAAILVFPDADAALARLADERTDAEVEVVDSPLLGFPAKISYSMFGPVTMVVVGNVQVWGWSVPPAGFQDTAAAADPLAALLMFSLRSVTNAVATLDHLRRTVEAA